MNKLFGTDGIRGTPGKYPLTDYMIYKIGSGIAHFIISKKDGRKRPKIVIGKDTRLSGRQIEAILANALTLRGIDVLLAGIITTPGLSFLTKNLEADMGIMISASHNKATDNGIKFFDAKGHKVSYGEEEKIEKAIFEHPVSERHPKTRGNIRIVKTAQTRYVKFLSSALQGLDLKGMRIALDCAFGAASPFARKIFRNLGAKVYSINDTPTGYNINEGGAINPAFLKELVLRTGAHIGIAVDGDGDRGILVDERGHVIDGDCIIAIVARYLLQKKQLPKNTVVATVMSNYGLKVALEEFGGKIISANVGDKYVLEGLLKNNLNLGGEQSGHIIFLDYLPTPDGLLTALQVLKVIQDTKSSLSQLAKCLTKYPQILVNIKVKEMRPFEQMSSLNKKLRHFNNRLKGEGRILLRYSGTEPLARVMVEGKDEALITEIAHSLADQIRNEIGS